MQRNVSQSSPGISTSEIDLTTIIPSTATSIGGFAGPFLWGPGDEITTISDENKLVEIFSTPTNNIAEYWFSASNFLAYSNNLKVVRILGNTSNNAISDADQFSTPMQIKNEADYKENFENNQSNIYSFAAKYAGTLGNSLSISICPSSNTYSQNLTSVSSSYVSNNAVYSTNTSFTVASDLSSFIKVGDLVSLSNTTVTSPLLEVVSINAQRINVASQIGVNLPTGAAITRKWKYFLLFPDRPSTSDYVYNRNGQNDEAHIVIIDTDGMFTGVKNAILEKFGFVSKANDAKTVDGSSNYYKNILNNKSKYTWWLKHPYIASNWGVSSENTSYTEASGTGNYYSKFLLGNDDDDINDSDIQRAYSRFDNPESTDISLIVSGPASIDTSNYLINMVENRQDAMVFISPLKSDVVEQYGQESTNLIARRETLNSSSYAFMDSNWKYQYDKYNDTYHWIPLNGDIAGLVAKTDSDRDAWVSPAGPVRGIIKNIVKLAWNPTKSDRDDIYLKGINPVVTFVGEGTMLYGDKTLQTRPSSFDRINVRRLFNTLEKTISKASRATLFDFNDEFSRAQFVSIVEPYLRDVKGRRGISDFRVVCDETNNTPEVISRNEFIGDIYIKPAYSVNFIQLNFIAVRTGVSFEEIVGKY